MQNLYAPYGAKKTFERLNVFMRFQYDYTIR